MKKFILILLIAAGFSASGQKKWQKLGFEIAAPVCYGSDKVVKSYIPVDTSVNTSILSSEKKSNIIVSYSLFPEEAKEAFEYAVDIWESIIESPVPIYMRANWRKMDKNVLGSCGPTDYLTNFKNIPQDGRYYPISVAEKLSQKEITGENSPDMSATFNKEINWYFGTDGNVPDSLYDFVTVVLHEIGHGLGFTGFFFVNQDLGTYGYYEIGEAAAFDILVQRNTGEFLVDTKVYKNPSEELRKALESGFLYAYSPVALFNSGGILPRLYAPSRWNEGSSLYHLNDATYPAGNENSLMTHAFGRAEAIHWPGPITQGIMADIGWQHLYIDFEELKDREEVSPLSFDVFIESDFKLDTSSLFVFFSLDSFQNHIDSIPLIATDEAGFFTAQLNPGENVAELFYYISARDVKTRTFVRPTEAPDFYFSVKFGPDTEKPVIIHDPVDYYFLIDNELVISAFIDDNIGVDTVYLEYAVNDIMQETVPLVHDTFKLYKGTLIFDENVDDGDKISYTITAKDASTAENVARLPEEGNFTFRIEKLQEAVGGYKNDFNTTTSDFILSDFDIHRPRGFVDAALHSPHPYPSPEIDDSVFNFSTILKHPIILQEGGTMTFDEIVLIEPGSPGTVFGDENFWDFVVVEGSKDEGQTWYPLAPGYDSRADETWEEIYSANVDNQVSSAVGKPEMFISREIDLLQNFNFSAGDTIIIRFRLFSDPYAHGWGWAIDNLRIQFPVSARQPLLSPGNITVYPNPFENLVSVKIVPKSEVKNVQIDVFNLFGQKIKSTLFENKSREFTQEIQLANVNSGIYLITVREDGKQVFTKKIIKK